MTADDLSAYLAAAEGRRVDYETWDCCQYVRGWIARRLGVDVGFDGYRGEREALWLVHRAGGLVALLSGLASQAALETTDRPERGDVGVLFARGALGSTAMGGIFAGRRWAVLGRRGIAYVTAEPTACWRV